MRQDTGSLEELLIEQLLFSLRPGQSGIGLEEADSLLCGACSTGGRVLGPWFKMQLLQSQRPGFKPLLMSQADLACVTQMGTRTLFPYLQSDCR